MALTPFRDIDFKQAASLALAAFTALLIAKALGFAHAYWAPMSVWVVAQPYRDHVMERGLFRLLGTILGAVAGGIIVWANLGALPSLVLVALWIGIVGGAQNLWTTGRRYMAFMAGMTAAVVVLPSLLATTHNPGVAVERVLCVMIGVVCATLIVGLMTPPSPEWTARRVSAAKPAPPTAQIAWGKMLRASAVSGIGTFAFGFVGIATGFRFAELAALGFAIFSLILSGVQHPRKAAPILLTGVTIGTVFACLYRIGILPLLGSPLALLVCMLVFIVIGALARAHKPSAAPALDANMVFLLIGQASLTASTDWSSVTAEGLSVIIAALVASGLVLAVARSDAPDRP